MRSELAGLGGAHLGPPGSVAARGSGEGLDAPSEATRC
jgi:hypothetical protein